jgi:hypothetical protein
MEAIKASIWLRDFVDGSDFTRGYPPPASTQYPLFNPRSPLVAGQIGTKEERDREFERLDGVLTEQIRKSESELGGVFGGDVNEGPEQALRMNFKRSALMCQVRPSLFSPGLSSVSLTLAHPLQTMTLIHLVSEPPSSLSRFPKLTLYQRSTGDRPSLTKEVLASSPRGCAAYPRAFLISPSHFPRL